MSSVRPRSVPDSIIDTGNEIARNMLGQPEVDRQLSTKFGNMGLARQETFAAKTEDALDIPFEEETDDFGFESIDTQQSVLTDDSFDLDQDFSIA